MKTKTLISLGLGLAISGAAFAAGDTYTIKHAPKENDTFKYKLVLDMDANGTPIQYTGTVKDRVVKVEADGTYQLESAQIDGHLKLGDNEMDAPGQPASLTVMKPGGTIVEIRGENVSATAYRMAYLSALLEPTKPVAIGDTWVQELKADAKTSGVATRSEYKVLAAEKVGTHDTLKIRSQVKETTGDSPASSDMTVWLDTTTWAAVKAEGTWTNAPIPGTPTPMNAKIKMTLID